MGSLFSRLFESDTPSFKITCLCCESKIFTDEVDGSDKQSIVSEPD